MKRLILLAFIVIGLTTYTPALAVDAAFKISTTYTLSGSDKDDVNMVVQLDDSDADLPSTLVLPLAGADIENVKVSDAERTELSSSVNEDTSSVEISLIDSGLDSGQSISVSYSANVDHQLGASKVLIISPNDYEGLTIASETVYVDSDLESGTPIIRSQLEQDSDLIDGREVKSWSNETGRLESQISLIYGEATSANFSVEAELINSSFWWTTKEITLPPDTNQQKIILNSIEPRPSDMHLDVDGNIIAYFSLRPKQNLTIKATGEIYTTNLSYNINKSSKIDDVPENIKSNYTSLNSTWEDGSLGSDIDSNLTAGEITEQIYEEVRSNIDSEATGYDEATRAANRLIGELRAAGVPARLVLGQTFSDGLSVFAQAQSHAWAEAYIPGTGWITLDALADRNGTNFGTSDVARLGLVLRGLDPDYPPQDLDNYQLAYINDPPEEPSQAVPTLSSTNYMVLPGVAINRTNVDMGIGTIVDNAAISSKDSTMKLGSLAPLQLMKVYGLSFGLDAFSSDEVNYGILQGDSITQPLATTNTSINYLPLATIVLIASSVLGFVIWRRRRSGGPKTKKKDSGKTKANLVFSTEADGRAIENEDLIPTTEPSVHVAAINQSTVVHPPTKEQPKAAPTTAKQPSTQPSNNSHEQQSTKSQANPSQTQQQLPKKTVNVSSVGDTINTSQRGSATGANQVTPKKPTRRRPRLIQ